MLSKMQRHLLNSHLERTKMSRTNRNKTYIPRDAQFTRYRTKVKTAVKDTIARESSRDLESQYHEDIEGEVDATLDEYTRWEIYADYQERNQRLKELEQKQDWSEEDEEIYYDHHKENKHLQAERGQLFSDLGITNQEIEAMRSMSIEQRGPRTMTDLRALQMRWVEDYKAAMVTRLLGGRLEHWQEWLLENFNPNSLKLAPRGVDHLLKYS